MKITMVFRWRAHATAVYLQKAFEAEGHEVTTVDFEKDKAIQHRVNELGNPVVVVDNGCVTAATVKLMTPPVVLWAMDDPLHLEDRNLIVGKAYKYVFTGQKDSVPAYHSAGIPASWLPFACDPTIHKPMEIANKYDIAFVGYLNPYATHGIYGDRVRRIAILGKYHTVWAGEAYLEKMTEIYNQAWIGFNASGARDLNMRNFEIAACGVALLTDRIDNGQAEIFPEGQACLTYTSDDDMVEKANRLIEDHELRRSIAREGQRIVTEKHTYRHRAVEIIRKFGEI